MEIMEENEWILVIQLAIYSKQVRHYIKVLFSLWQTFDL